MANVWSEFKYFGKKHDRTIKSLKHEVDWEKRPGKFERVTVFIPRCVYCGAFFKARSGKYWECNTANPPFIEGNSYKEQVENDILEDAQSNPVLIRSIGWKELEVLPRNTVIYVRRHGTEGTFTLLNLYIVRGGEITLIKIPEHPDCKKSVVGNDYTWYTSRSAGSGNPHRIVKDLGKMVHGNPKYFKSLSI